MPKKKAMRKTEVPVKSLDEGDCLRVLEHIVTQRITTVLGAHQLVLRDASMPKEVFREVCRSKAYCHEIMGKVNIISELTEKIHSVANLHLAAYSVESFFTTLTERLNAIIGERMPGKVCFLLRENSEPEAAFDAKRVSAVIYHLVFNALKHGRTSDKTVEIHCFVKQHKMKIAIRDFGGGFVSSQDDMGVGLPFCQKLATDMRGELHIHNYKTGVKAILTVPLLKSSLFQKEEFCFDEVFRSEYPGLLPETDTNNRKNMNLLPATII